MSTSTPPIILISRDTFHHRLTLSTLNGPLTVSYADIGSPTGPALLLLPGMFASRYLGIPMHAIAQRAGVRLLVVDRPGIGASSEVPLANRIDAWVDMLPRLLSHLGIPRISLVAHSAGTFYLFNTLVRCREVVGRDVFFLGMLLYLPTFSTSALCLSRYMYLEERSSMLTIQPPGSTPRTRA